ncbi:Hypothetical protein DEACI_1883 [Acididesulfobacillus acetoxydans]|uniref:Toxin-antitoxin system protein n=1 Tax=Acididesulfobacillus acetoxydans TaxID=1561005 RepID=A0A8S0X503_9FIRM|nr:toxin-antitoxin system protein [Acididesulfobacillus acetoxydans]CAA7601230.1 Hypothetical protein DEACI_1883 [Acididesulfobacillus acetoxydans]CEJ08491.1 Hypothetical protein DEACI_2968 [Acididesulfobacillus acetoxydans]
MSTTIRINSSTLQVLKQIALQTGEPTQTTLDKAIEAYRRQVFLQQANNAFAELQKKPELWQEELSERQEWETTCNDDLWEDNR